MHLKHYRAIFICSSLSIAATSFAEPLAETEGAGASHQEHSPIQMEDAYNLDDIAVTANRDQRPT